MFERTRRLNCLRCGYSWRPRIDAPKKCPKCSSKKWIIPLTTNPMDVKEIFIKGEQHPFYNYHYHITPNPSFPQKLIADLIIENIKSMFGMVFNNAKEGFFAGNNYRIRSDSIEKCRDDEPKYFNRVFRLSLNDTERIHILDLSDEGRDLLKEVLGYCFPNAKIEIIDKTPSGLEAEYENWKSMGLYKY